MVVGQDHEEKTPDPAAAAPSPLETAMVTAQLRLASSRAAVASDLAGWADDLAQAMDDFLRGLTANDTATCRRERALRDTMMRQVDRAVWEYGRGMEEEREREREEQASVVLDMKRALRRLSGRARAHVDEHLGGIDLFEERG